LTLAALLTAAAGVPQKRLSTTLNKRASQPPVVRLGPIQELQQSEAGQHHQGSYEDYQDTANHPPIIQTAPAPKTEQEAAGDQKEGPEKSSPDWWLVKLTAGLLAVGAIQTLVFGIQAIRLKQTILKMDDVAKDASNIGQLQVRAYVSIAEATVEMREIWMFGQHFADEPRFKLKISNTGNSSALKFRVREETIYVYDTTGNALRGGHHFFSGDRGRDIPNGVSEIERDSLDSRLNTGDLIKFYAGELQMVATFHFIYEDVFGKVTTEAVNFWTKFPLDMLRAELPMKVHSIDAAKTAFILKKGYLAATKQNEAHTPEGGDK